MNMISSQATGPRMRLVVVGNGMAGMRTVEEILARAPENQRGMLLSKLTNPGATRFEIDKFNWLTSLNSETAVVMARHGRRAGPDQVPARSGE